MASSDFYGVLGVSRTATADEIRKAYKSLSAKYHPDRNPDDDAALKKYKEIQEAYSVLKDPEKRKKYDRFGDHWEAAGSAGGGAPFGGGAGPVDLGDLFGDGGIDLGDLFGGGFGGGGRRRTAPRARKGQDLSLEIEVSFHLAVEGGTYDLRFSRDGKTDHIDVKIPAGVPDGGTIRLSGLGHSGSGGGPAGDLLLKVKVSPHPYFRRDGKNLQLDLPITPAEAVLGTKVDVPVLPSGSVVLTIPPGTGSGKKLRVRGKGAPARKGGERGDLIVITKVVVDPDMSSEVQAIYEQLSEAERFNPREQLW